MTVDFGNGIGRVTDDSREASDEIRFLVTKLNSAFVDEAREKGAQIVTPRALIDRLRLGGMDVVGITGTNGKTTTAAASYSILLDLGYKAALQGTRGLFINDEKVEEKSLTTPPSLATIARMAEAKRRGCEFFVMEVSSHAIEQERIEGIDFALKIHTNITSDHLDYHGSIEAYRAVKSSFFQDSGKKLINRDEEILKFNIQNTYSYGIENPATYKVMAYTLGGGVSGVLRHFETIVPFETALQGFFNLYNVTAAIAAAHILTDEDLGEICEAAENFGGVAGRMETVREEPLIIVDFAHTEDGLKQVLAHRERGACRLRRRRRQGPQQTAGDGPCGGFDREEGLPHQRQPQKRRSCRDYRRDRRRDQREREARKDHRQTRSDFESDRRTRKG